jgi:hypothetical protein
VDFCLALRRRDSDPYSAAVVDNLPGGEGSTMANARDLSARLVLLVRVSGNGVVH